MGHYSRLLTQEARAADQVMAYLRNYPFERRASGIAVKELMRDYPDRLKCASSVIAAIYLLEEERQIMLERSCGHENCLDGLRAHLPEGIEIPPGDQFFLQRDVHVLRKRECFEDVVQIDFYRAENGKYFVWPFVGQIGKYSSSHKHFKLRMHFDDIDSARECAINQGATLIELGFLHQQA
jgi:hypothetical protein